MAHGRSTDKEKAKIHIMKRARDMGKEDMLPASWVTKKKDGAVSAISDADFMQSLVEFQLLTNEDGDDDGLA
jgi:hypothetical protein